MQLAQFTGGEMPDHEVKVKVQLRCVIALCSWTMELTLDRAGFNRAFKSSWFQSSLFQSSWLTIKLANRDYESSWFQTNLQIELVLIERANRADLK